MEWTLLLLDRDLQGFALELGLFPDEARIWETLPGISNSAGTLTLHVCGNLQHFVGTVLGGTGYVRDRPLEFSARGVARTALLAELERTRQVVQTVLPGLSEADLAAPYPDVLDGIRPPTGLFLHHLSCHLSHHLGQAGYLRRALTGENRSSGAISMQSLAGAEAGRIGPGDPRYLAVVSKRFNKRFSASPDYVRLISSAAQVVPAVDEAVREGRRLVVTSGGHCLEGFVSDPDVRVILDVSAMKGMSYDAERGAVAVEAGATVGETFRALFEKWGVVVPLGEYPEIGMGGHVAGGAFGFLCRQLGLAADYLHAVEVVTVGENGRARRVVATREASDPNRDLWWAHTGGGGGNFGIVTRYWFRAPDASGEDPATLLPRAPESITTFKAEWDWSDLDESSFLRLLQNHGAWCERNSGAGSPEASLWALLEIHRKQLGKIVVRGVSTAGAAAERQMEEHLAALGEGITAPHGREIHRMSWLDFALNPLPDLFAAPPGGVSSKVKDALLRKRLTDRQIAVAYEHLTRADLDVMGGMLGLATYGGRINTVAPDETASAQRSSILDIACTTGWLEPREEETNLAWVRGFYRDLFAETGGVPVPGEAYDGSLINHPDTDLADPALNTSGVPWHTLYYQANYERLQRVKARWDPLNVFHHALSIRR